MKSLEKIVLGACIAGITACKQDYSIVEQPEETLCVWTDSFDQPTQSQGADIIWVIDTSGSMSDDQNRLFLGIEAMMNALPAGDWRLNMISTDPTMVLYDQQFPLVPGDTLVDAQTMYSYMAKGTLEEGFAAIMTYIDQNPYAQTWMRDDAALLVVFVSDEEEQSFFGMTDAEAINEFEQWFDSLRFYNYAASIVHFPKADSLCNPSDIDVGERYIQVTKDYNGVVIDICSEDWSPGVEDASENLSLLDSWPLKYTPDEYTVTVFVESKLYPSSKWEYDEGENTVFFNEVPTWGSHVDVSYNINEKTYTECPSQK